MKGNSNEIMICNIKVGEEYEMRTINENYEKC